MTDRGHPAPAAPLRVVIGRLGAPHGVRGEVRLFPETDFPERLRRGRRVLMCPPHGPMWPTTIRSVRPLRPGVLLLAVRGLHTPAVVRPFAGGTLCAEADQLPPLPPGRYYHHQLVGLSVLRADGRLLGRLSEVLATGANDVFVVARPDGGSALIPAIFDAVAEIDLAAGVVRCRDLPGLLDD